MSNIMDISLFAIWDGVEMPNSSYKRCYYIGARTLEEAYEILEFGLKIKRNKSSFKKLYPHEDAIIQLYTLMNNQSGYFDTGGSLSSWYNLSDFGYKQFSIRNHYIDELLENLK